MIGETIGSYRVLAELGSGGMGAVYLAEHRHLGRRAAIKVLKRELCQRPDLLERFFAEARATSVLQHPGIVQVLDCEVDAAGRPFMVMELLEGETLNVHLHRRGRLPSEEAASLARGVAEALAAAHGRGIVHRDIKPDNVFVLPGPPPATKIVDFGIAKLAGDLAIKTNRTQTGAMMGTPLYMSPEQCRGAGTVDWRTDVYSLGCIYFEMLAGRPPFVYEGVGELVAAHLTEPAPLASAFDPTIPVEVDELVSRMLRKDPAERPQSMQEVAGALAAFVGPTGTTAAPTPVPTPPPGAPGAISIPSELRRTPVETTLRGSATEVTDLEEGAEDRPARTRRGPLLAGLAVAALAGVVAIWVRGRKASDEDETAAAPAPSAAAAVPAPPASPPPAPPSPIPAVTTRAAALPDKKPDKKRAAAAERTRVAAAEHKPPAAEHKPPPPAPERKAQAHLTIESDPPGAEVCLASDHVLLGHAGVSVEVPADGAKVPLFVRLAGYRVERIVLRADRDQRQLVHLRPLGPDDLESASPCRRKR